jgi:NAD(P)H-quinone oxidoreductase subunit 5
MVHILAHSLYKAHAFLSSGSVVAQAQAVRGSAAPKVQGWRPLGFAFAAVALGMASIYGISMMIGFGPASKPGGLVLMFVLAMALTIWCWRLFTLGQRRTVILGVLGSYGLALFYYLSYVAVDAFMTSPPVAAMAPGASLWLTAGVAVAFAALFALHQLAASRHQPSWLHALHVHASNGFYIDSLYRRFIVPLAQS